MKYVKLKLTLLSVELTVQYSPGGVFFAVHKFTEVPGDKKTLRLNCLSLYVKDIPLNNVHANSRVTTISIT